MNKILRTLFTLAFGMLLLPSAYAQQDVENPTILYGQQRRLPIGGIKVEGVENYEDYLLIGISGLSIGEQVTLPGDEITAAVKRYWKHGLFSSVRIEAEKIQNDSLYLKIILAARPRVSEININGVRKSEKEDLEEKIGIMKGIQITRQIRKVVGMAVPVVVLTSYDWIDIEKEAIEAGVTSFFAKPLFPSDLHCILQKFCGSSSDLKLDHETLSDEPKKYDFTGRKVMIVEDNILNREISTEILEDRGVEVTAMERGDLAVEKLKYSTVKYDAVLMDIQMPGIDGYEATRQIRKLENPDIANVPIIAMTANAFEEDKRAAMDAGMNDHVAKPVDVEVLCATLAKFFR